jgi:galactokinase
LQRERGVFSVALGRALSLRFARELFNFAPFAHPSRVHASPGHIADAPKTELQKHYGVAPEHARVVRSPYRICPLGAHIDHQLGQVTAMAIARAVYFAFASNERPEVCLRSLSFPGEVRFSLHDIPPKRAGDWETIRAAQSRLWKKAGTF